MRQMLPLRLWRALIGALVLWLTGMIVGTVVFSVPQLRALPEIPYVSANPAITAPIILLWLVLARWLARPHVTAAPLPTAEGLRVGAVFLAVNALLDGILVAGMMGNGLGFYSHLGVWVAYTLLILMPWMTGRAALPAAPLRHVQ